MMAEHRNNKTLKSLRSVDTVFHKSTRILFSSLLISSSLSLFAYQVSAQTTQQTQGQNPGYQLPPSQIPQQQGQAQTQGQTQPQNATQQQNPLGVGANQTKGWQAEVKEKNPNQPIDMDDETAEFVQKISDYFNVITDLKGRFLQTNPDNNQSKGTFYVKRPGRLRFDYAPPSRLRIVSDGELLSIEDHDINSTEAYPLESTPFKLLLNEKVDLLKDAKILDISRGQDIAIITVVDKKDDSSGKLKLLFAIPELELKEWIITDPQGLDTRLQITELTTDEVLKPELFQLKEVKAFEGQ